MTKTMNAIRHLIKPMPPEVHHKLGIPLKPLNHRQVKIAEGLHKLHGLSGQEDKTTPVCLQVPDNLSLEALLAEVSLREKHHIERLNSLLYSTSHKLSSVRVPPVMPFGAGWWVWTGRRWEAADQPGSVAAVLDFETTWTNPDQTEWFPVCCVVLDADARIWAWLADPDKDPSQTPLIDVGPDALIVGHNVSYDRSFLSSEYLIKPSTNRFWDTMSAFIAVRGITNQQRAALTKSLKDKVNVGKWTDETTTNGLDAVHEFYGLGTLDKGVRKQLVDNGWSWVRSHLQEVLRYCIADVIATLRVFQHVYPEWLLAQPSPVSRWAQVELGSVWVPLSPDRWPGYAGRCDRMVGDIELEATDFLKGKVEAVIAENLDPCKALAKELKPVRKAAVDESKALVWDTPGEDPKEGEKARKKWVEARFEELAEPYLDRFCADLPVNLASLDWTPALSGKTLGLPKWYRDIKEDGYGVRKRWAPLVLGMTWNNSPIYWDDEAVPPYKNDAGNPGDRAGFVTDAGAIPHPEKRGKRVTSVFAKGFVDASEKGFLSSPDTEASDMLKKYVSTTLWASMQSRIHSLKIHSPEGFPVCIPRMAVTGTITRRCADSVWQVLANPKAKRIGSELKSLIEAPPGYKFVGADVEAQEAWIAAILGDMLSGGANGATGFAYSIYIGEKASKTDFHSLNQKFADLGDRDTAKPLGFGTLYGAGVAGNADYLQKVQPHLSRSEAETKASVFVGKFKGERDRSGCFAGGLASEAFNAMAMISGGHNPETPVLKVKLTKALAGIRDFATTRNNWVVQSSGADFRDCLVAFGAYLFERFNIDGRLILTIHDEIRYMVADRDVRKAAYALQLAHLYTRALFVREMGMDCLPASVAWFPLIDVDHVIRKEVFLTCQTPSQPEAIAPGYSLKPGDLTEYLAE